MIVGVAQGSLMAGHGAQKLFGSFGGRGWRGRAALWRCSVWGTDSSGTVSNDLDISQHRLARDGYDLGDVGAPRHVLRRLLRRERRGDCQGEPQASASPRPRL